MKILCVSILALALAACGGGNNSTCPPIDQHLAAVNAVRAPLPALKVDATLQHVAQSHAEYQSVRQRDLDRPHPEGSLHFDANGNRVQARLAAAGYPHYAEEIAAAGLDTAPEVMQAYLGSEGHRPWLLWAAANEVGLGCSVAASGRVYWVHVLGSKQ
jgi:uncharacterized protein YkwD